MLPKIEKQEAVKAWIIDDTGCPKHGVHSVGVARQYCGQLGEQAACQVAVSLSIANHHAGLPIAYQQKNDDLFLKRKLSEALGPPKEIDEKGKYLWSVPPDLRVRSSESYLDISRETSAASPKGLTTGSTRR